jgi:hypothetical protein
VNNFSLTKNNKDQLQAPEKYILSVKITPWNRVLFKKVTVVPSVLKGV